MSTTLCFSCFRAESVVQDAPLVAPSTGAGVVLGRAKLATLPWENQESPAGELEEPSCAPARAGRERLQGARAASIG